MTDDDSASAHFYHGTGALAAVRVSVEGFQVDEFNRGRGQNMLGYGTYLTARLAVAADFGDYVFRVRLAPGTRILRLDGRYDRSVIDSLRREFGRELLRFDFGAAIPKNKHLRRVELIALLNYLWAQFGRLDLPSLPHAGRLHRYLVKSGYEALGCDDNYAGILVYNSSRVRNDGLFHTCKGTKGLRPVGPAEPANEAAGSIIDLVRRGPPDKARATAERFRRLVKHSRHCLRSFCTRHGIATTAGKIAEAMGEI